MGLTGLLGALPAEVPVEPDAPEARDWLIEELAKPEYQAAKPTLLDLIGKAIMDWLDSLFVGGEGAPPGLALGIVLALIAVGILVAFLIFGVPRVNRRSTVTGALFGQDDTRTAEQLRRAAQSAAARGDYAAAIADCYRSIARGLAERTIVTTTPGTTAQGFAVRAGSAFPEHRGALADAATSFDGVRYLGDAGTPTGYEQVRELERALRTARPAALEEVQP